MADDIGAHLREARERAGITLRDVAAATKISVPALEALERNDIGRLPGGIFVRAFGASSAGTEIFVAAATSRSVMPARSRASRKWAPMSSAMGCRR